jgi:hypothetical protein
MPHIVDEDDALLMDDEFEDASSEDLDLDEPDKPDIPAKPDKPEKAGTSEKSEPQDSGSPVGDDDEESESYSKRVQKRISKLTGRMRELERETGFWKEKVTALETKTQAKEIAEFQSQAEWTAHELSRQIDQARAEKKTAIEEGDVDQQLKLDEKILDLREQLTERKRIATAAKEQAAQFQETQSQFAKPTATPAQPTIPDTLPVGTKQWLRTNPWFMKNEDPKAAEFARLLDASLQEEGYNPDDPAMYVELDKRLQGLMPRLAKSLKTPPKPKVAGSSVDGQRANTTTKPQRKLTSDDLAKMKRYGFDPNKPEHRKNWLRRFDPL